MPEYSCDCCNFSTTKKSTFNDHLSSQKHLNNSKKPTMPIKEVDSNNHYILQIKNLEIQLKNKEYEYESKIKDLENQLKIKELEMKNIISEFTLKLQLSEMKLNEPKISIPQNTENNIQLVITTPTKEEDKIVTKETTLDKLNKRTKAMTIEYFKNNCLNDETFNTFIQSVSFNNVDDFMLPKSIEPSDYSDYIVVDVVCKTLNNIPTKERPIYCSDVRRRHFYIKTEEGWIKHNEDTTNKILQDLFWSAYKVIFKAFADLKTHKNFNFILDKLYKKDNKDNKAELFVQKITSNLYPLKEERDNHYGKLNVKLSEMTNDKNSKYKSEDKKEARNKSNSTHEDDNNDEEMY
jgi:hypothetical protein